MFRSITLAVIVAVLAMPVSAQTWSSNAPVIGAVSQPENVYMPAYPTSENYCPQGLQPVTRGGVICCGTPTAGAEYAPAPQRQMSCPAGTKGCS